MLPALGLLLVVEAAGLAAAPLAALLLGRLPGAGLGFAKVLGMLLVTWLVWIVASVTPVPYGRGLVVGALLALVAAGALAGLRLRGLRERIAAAGEPRGRVGRWRAGRLARLALPPEDAVRRRLFWGAEAVFAVGYGAMTLLASLSPDVWGTEKPMDMAFISALDASTSFPPHDPWLSGASLNYYYLGHLVLAWPVELLGLAPDAGYLLAWGLLFGLSASAVFAFGGTLWAAAREALGERAPRGGPVAAGLLAVALVVVLGDLAGVRAYLAAAHPPGDYDWFAPSRVIPGTINEFPAFSFTLGDLHAHVIALPFTVLVLAFALQVALSGPRGDVVWRAVGEALAVALAIGALYAMNSWSWPVAAALLAAAVAVWARDPSSAGRRAYAAVWLPVVLLASVVLLLPFWLQFDPAASGLGVVGTRRPFARFLGDHVLIYGLFAWPLAAAYLARLRAARHPWRIAGWGLAGLLVLGTALAAADLTGALLVAVAFGVAVHAGLSRALAPAERFLWVLVAAGAGLVLAGELIYLRDAFDHSALFRMNTIFKLGYQAYLVLGLAAACAIPWAAAWLPRRLWPAWAAVTAALLLLGAVYPWAGTYARKNGFSASPSLDGLAWLRDRAPGDPGAIAWVREHAAGDAVILEAVGDDYSAFGEGRVSTFSGRPAVLGWAGHEVQWSHDVGSRIADVRTLYTTTDPTAARTLLDRYGVGYVVAGPIERADYGDAGLGKFDQLGRRVYDRAGTVVWALR